MNVAKTATQSAPRSLLPEQGASGVVSPQASVLILTKNEQQDLAACLESVAWSDDVHVYDSGSTDGTISVAERYGASVISRSYAGSAAVFGGDEAAHRNWGLSNIPFRHPWVFMLDADERASSSLVEGIARAMKTDRFSAYRIERRDYLMSTWLRHVQATPTYVRLFRPEKIHYERLINPVTVVDGLIGEVAGHIDHYPFSKGYTQWIDKHNHYSTLEARQIAANCSAGGRFSFIKALTARDSGERRYHQKEFFYRLPCRPLVKFLVLYVGKGGFLDGKAGFTYAALQSIYEYFIVLKTREIRQQERLSQ